MEDPTMIVCVFLVVFFSIEFLLTLQDKYMRCSPKTYARKQVFQCWSMQVPFLLLASFVRWCEQKDAIYHPFLCKSQSYLSFPSTYG